MNNSYILIDNIDGKRFEIQQNRSVAFIEYLINNENIFLIHTEVPKELGGRGIGSAIVKQTLEEIDNRKLRLIPMCAFVKVYLERHPEWKRLLVKKQ